MKNQKGQTILILLLIMTIALGIGLSIVEKSFTDVSTASKVEQSLRAFSAAEAGIEKAIKGSGTSLSFTDNSSSAVSSDSGPLPAPGQPLEYPKLSKEEIAQVWLVSPIDLSSNQYSGSTLDVYWGNQGVSVSDTPALEVGLIYKSTDAGSPYKTKKYFFDRIAGSANRTNGFSIPTNCPSTAPPTYFSTNKVFDCKQSIDVSHTPSGISDLSSLVMLRARILYSKTSQSFAVAPTGGLSLPAQAHVYVSTGVAGDTKRRVQLFKLDKVVPFYFDYALFSAGDITK